MKNLRKHSSIDEILSIEYISFYTVFLITTHNELGIRILNQPH